MTTTLACKSNEAVLNLGIMMCISQSMSVCAKSCMEVLVPGEGTIFSTCTLCEGNTPRTQSILGANGVIVRQEWVMPNKAWRLQTSSPSSIRSLLFLAYSHGAEAQSSIRGEAALLPPPPSMELQTWIPLYLPLPKSRTLIVRTFRYNYSLYVFVLISFWHTFL